LGDIKDKMAELTINQLIKIIIGILVVVAVVGGLYFFFKDSVMDFFNNLPTGKIILGVLR
jgi:hypothetical protein